MPESFEPYDGSHFDPPAPVARVTVRGSGGAVTASDVLLLLDTGADVTLLPRGAVERIGVPVRADGPYELMGFDESQSSAPFADLDMIFQGRAFRGRYLLTEEEQGILGRDGLNHLSLLLDGPKQHWSPHRP